MRGVSLSGILRRPGPVAAFSRKAAEKGICVDRSNVNWGLLDSEYEKELAVKIYFYKNALQLAAERRDCSSLVEYLLDLAMAFNRFYRECPVLAAENDSLVVARLALAAAVKEVLADGLKTLTIGVPEAM